MAAFRKLKALGMILADLGIPESTGRGNTQEVRAVVSTVFLVLGSLFLVGWIFLLSSTILPGTRSLLLLTPLLLFLAYLLRDTFNKVYVQGKGALVATFDNHALETDPVSREEKGHLNEARLETYRRGRRESLRGPPHRRDAPAHADRGQHRGHRPGREPDHQSGSGGGDPGGGSDSAARGPQPAGGRPRAPTHRPATPLRAHRRGPGNRRRRLTRSGVTAWRRRAMPCPYGVISMASP